MATDPQNDTFRPSGGVNDHAERADNRQSAVDLARRKLDAIYGTQKTMTSELAASQEVVRPESKHQRFMRELSTSGKSLAQIQIEWHDYYAGLPDAQKHEVWQEFYATNSQKTSAGSQNSPLTATAAQPPSVDTVETNAVVTSQVTPQAPPRLPEHRRPLAIRKRILEEVKTAAVKPPKSKRRQGFESLFFGLGIGVIAVIIFLFGFFNEYIIAPFIQPSRTVSATPIILDSGDVAVSKNPEVIIPKIGVQIPVDYSLKTVDEDAIQTALDEAVVHYANTVKPGQVGNTAIFGHSSNNIFNKGKYKFAFVLLHKLTEGDTFYLTYNGTLYAYKVFKTQVVLPDETWVLDPVQGKTATATLITCDPPGSTRHRLVVWGEQISPSPTSAQEPSAADKAAAEAAEPIELTGKGPSAWSRFWSWLNPFN